MAEEAYGLANASLSTSGVLIHVGQDARQRYKFDDRFERVWHRWLRYTFKSWHTDSLQLSVPWGLT